MYGAALIIQGGICFWSSKRIRMFTVFNSPIKFFSFYEYSLSAGKRSQRASKDKRVLSRNSNERPMTPELCRTSCILVHPSFSRYLHLDTCIKLPCIPFSIKLVFHSSNVRLNKSKDSTRRNVGPRQSNKLSFLISIYDTSEGENDELDKIRCLLEFAEMKYKSWGYN